MTQSAPSESARTLKFFLRSSYSTETIEWPVQKVSEKTAILVETPGGLLWLSPTQREELQLYRNLNASFKEGFFKVLERVTAASSESMVPVKKAGKGKTEKSHKFKVIVRRKVSQEHPIEELTRTLILPVGKLAELEPGCFYLSKWQISSHLAKGEFVVGVWPGIVAIKRQFDQAFARMQAVEEEKSREAREEWERQRPQREEKERLRLESMAQSAREAEEAEARKKARPVKIPDKVRTNCTVKLVEWEHKSGSWRGRDIIHLSCRVEYYGNKRVVTTSTGEVITKMKGPNLSITQEVPSENKTEPSPDT